MILQLLAARIAERSDSQCQWARHIYRCLLLLSNELLIHGIALPLFELIELRLLKDVVCQGWRYCFPATHYLAASGFLADVLWHIDGVECTALTSAQRLRYMQRMLNGNFGFDCFFALNPYMRLESIDRPLPNDLAGEILESMRLFIWAWNMRYERREHNGFPPRAVFDGTDLHAFVPEISKQSETGRCPCAGT